MLQISIAEIKTNKDMTQKLSFSVDFQNNELGFRLLSPLVIVGEAINKGKYILVKGAVKTVAALKCALCDKETPYNIEVDFLEGYALNQEIPDPEGEFDIHSFDGSCIDIEREVVASISLALPMRVICREDCRGLCPNCGADLNEGECACQKKTIDPRFAILKDFQFDCSDKEV